MDFIINSEEFLIFSRPNGDIEKNLGRLPLKVPTATQIERMQKATDIKERNYDLSEKERFNLAILDFSIFAKKVIPMLKQMKKTFEGLQQIKTTSIANNKGLYNILNSYEELNLNVYVEHQEEKKIFHSEKNQKLYQEQVDSLMNNMNNPFVDMYHWCKGEIYDIQAISDALESRESVEKELKKLESKKKNA